MNTREGFGQDVNTRWKTIIRKKWKMSIVPQRPPDNFPEGGEMEYRSDTLNSDAEHEARRVEFSSMNLPSELTSRTEMVLARDRQRT